MPPIDVLLAEGASALRRAGIESAVFDARELLLHSLGLPDTAALFRTVDVAPDASARYRRLIRRRARRYPLQYLLGFWEFYGRRFVVREGVLIPRPDTETLVDAALELPAPYGGAALEMLDLCSGSGNLAITLALELPGARADALELSGRALEVLHENVRSHQAQVNVLRGDVCHFVPDRKYGLIISNPPYVTEGEYASLQPEVLFEPRMALAAGENGLYFYKAIIRRYPAYLEPGGVLLLEAGAGQAGALESLLRQSGCSATFTRNDCGGIARAVGGIF